PHCGYLRAAQPSLLSARALRSLQPTGLPGQPSASAIGFHMAITTGLSTRFFVLPNNSLPPLALASALPRMMNALLAGLLRWALRFSVSNSSMHSPLPMGMAVTRMVRAPTLAPDWLNAAVTSLIQVSFSEP